MSAHDPLSLTLASLSWPRWHAGFLEFDQDGPGVEVSQGAISLYVVRRGDCTLESADLPEPVLAQEGDVLLLPHGGAHRLATGAAQGTVDFERFRAARNGSGAVNLERPVNCVVFGHHRMQVEELNPLDGHLSSLLHLSRANYPQLAEMEPLLRVIEAEDLKQRAGWQAISSQLVQVIFHQALRAFVAQQSWSGIAPQEKLVGDPTIGLVVGLLNAQLERPWTVGGLARWVNMSRSAFSERFRVVTGKPPLQYLTELRMARACHLLRHSDQGVKQIAAMVGYESPSSFTNAFKRWHGNSPVSYRAQGANNHHPAELPLCCK